MNTSILAFKPHFAPTDIARRITPTRPATAGLEDVASQAFVRTMRGAATGVSIVATDGPAGRYGLTVSAFSSVSAEPPMVLVCINRRSPACAAVRHNRRFCVNVLSQAQRSMANTFAGRPEAGDAYEFHAASWTSSATGAPRLDGCTASFDCVLQTSIDAGTHSIFIGAVKALESTGTSPLVYVDGAYSHTCSKS